MPARRLSLFRESRPSVRMILPVQTADEMAAWLRKYRAKGNGRNGDERATAHPAH